MAGEMMGSKYNYGWKPDKPDERDHIFKFKLSATAKKLPTSVNLTSMCPPIYNQGNLGSCTGQAIAAAVAYSHKKVESKELDPSKLFIYYNERELEGTVNEDSGASIRDGIKVVNKFGVCPESMWPYVIPKFAVKPTAACYTAALKDKVLKYERLMQMSSAFRGCIATGFPFVFGMLVFPSMETATVARTGVVPMPGPNEEPLGGHAVLCVGYNDLKRRFLIRNSWGTSWGDHGYFTLPYEYMFNSSLTADFWTIYLVAPSSTVQKVHTKSDSPVMVNKEEASNDVNVQLNTSKKDDLPVNE